MPGSDLAKMGHINARSGVCGFVSALMAIYDADGVLNNEKAAVFRAATQPGPLFREVHSCLQSMVDQNRVALVKDVEDFTRTFGLEYRRFTVANYLKSGADNVTPEMLKLEAVAVLLSVAMPPDGVLFFLHNIGLTASRRVDVGANTPKYIVGVRDTANKDGKGMHGGLVHWMYVSGGRVYSWGNEYASITDAGKFTEVCRICVGLH